MHSPAAERNKEHIRKVLTATLPVSGHLLEVASGSLQHALHIAPALPNWTWQPTEASDQALAHAANLALPSNVRSPWQLDTTRFNWTTIADGFDAVFVANLTHISPLGVTEALLRGAGTCLVENGHLLMYGPFNVDGQFTSPGNARFDASLRDENPEFGIRDVELIEALAYSHGLQAIQRIAMPANNLILHFTSKHSK